MVRHTQHMSQAKIEKDFILELCMYIMRMIKDDRSAVTPFRCLVAMPPDGSTRVGKPPCCPNLDRSSRDARVVSESQIFRSLSSRQNHSYLSSLLLSVTVHY
ncbi:hypothetical protein T265_04731 [Opisthorchis viverrini]|uniref:Uncharacterized protein n=1 Tax=Opisthorchis viverrini TaxID=6198 RepID=A0A074ZM13_OPIVI|nr:hypothetical protein T265_04731 [Opisthorchis viverrini]KER28418.1 hypothetical protein T265_04731 [Opisthorchis viverrini]